MGYWLLLFVFGLVWVGFLKRGCYGSMGIFTVAFDLWYLHVQTREQGSPHSNLGYFPVRLCLRTRPPIQNNLKSIDIWGKACWLFPFQDSHHGNIRCQITFKSVSFVFPQCGEDTEWSGQVWEGLQHLQPEHRARGLTVRLRIWLLGIHSEVPMSLGLAPAFMFPTNRLFEGETGPASFLILSFLLLF